MKHDRTRALRAIALSCKPQREGKIFRRPSAVRLVRSALSSCGDWSPRLFLGALLLRRMYQGESHEWCRVLVVRWHRHVGRQDTLGAPLEQSKNLGRWQFRCVHSPCCDWSPRLPFHGALVLLSQGASGRISRLVSSARGPLASCRWAPGLASQGPLGAKLEQSPAERPTLKFMAICTGALSSSAGSPSRRARRSTHAATPRPSRLAS